MSRGDGRIRSLGASPRFHTVFLDRDGVLNRRLPGDYVTNPEQLEILPGVVEALANLKAAGKKLVLISNQRGVGRGRMTREDVDRVHAHLQAVLSAAGASLDAIYFCPDLESFDRKPSPGMLLRAKREHPEIDFASSAMVGDSATDMQAAAAVGAVRILVGVDRDAETAKCRAIGIEVHHVAVDLRAAADLLLGNAGRAGTQQNQQATLVSFAAVTWNFPLVGRTRMLSEAWSRAGIPNLFVQYPSPRTAIERFTARGDDAAHVLRPLPAIPDRCAGLFSRRTRERWAHLAAGELRRQLRDRLDWDNSVAIAVTPAWQPWLERLPFSRVIYDCIDDPRVHSRNDAHHRCIVEWERRLVHTCSAVCASAEILADRAAAFGRGARPDAPVIRVIRNGVDLARFDASRQYPRPGDLPGAGRPLIGFVGALYEWIDWELIRSVARANRGCEFVFVGPASADAPIADLAKEPNVRFLGARAYDQVPSYVAHFDVCWVPFDQSGISKAANPVKIYEYLAMGKPVITTRVADSHLLQGVCGVGSTTDEISDLLRGACDDPAGNRTARIAFASANSWDVRAQEFAALAWELPAGAARPAGLMANDPG
ncbi:MAG: HAD-IIIA family hydrolase [Phycisphaeraceae bacterium]|nr:HAD-IIIA family hydrolase [Phycisphaeraceae bacterium]